MCYLCSLNLIHSYNLGNTLMSCSDTHLCDRILQFPIRKNIFAPSKVSPVLIGYPFEKPSRSKNPVFNLLIPVKSWSCYPICCHFAISSFFCKKNKFFSPFFTLFEGNLFTSVTFCVSLLLSFFLFHCLLSFELQVSCASHVSISLLLTLLFGYFHFSNFSHRTDENLTQREIIT